MWFSHGHSIHQPSTTVMPMQPVVHSCSPNIASRSLLYQRWLVDRFPTDDEEDPAPRALGADPLHFQSLELEPLRSDERLLLVVLSIRGLTMIASMKKRLVWKKTDFEMYYKDNTTD